MPYDRPDRYDDSARPVYKSIRVEPLTPTMQHFDGPRYPASFV